MVTAVKTIAGIFLLILAYFVLWPTAVRPIAWQPPTSDGYVGDFAPNEKLVGMSLIPLNGSVGPEDIVAQVQDDDVTIYASSQDGAILRIDPRTNEVSAFADTGGHPLGVAFSPSDTLLVADAYLGLVEVTSEGDVNVLTNRVAGEPIRFADDVAVAPNGTVYFTDATTRFSAKAIGTHSASALDVLEQSQTGRVLAYDPQSGETSIIADGLSFANGIALSPDGNALFVAETGAYRVVKINIAEAVAPEPILVNLPGFPDNINVGPTLPDGTATYFLGLAGPRIAILDGLANRPFLRKVISRIPSWARPETGHYSFILQFTEDGKILDTWQDPAGTFTLTTGAIAPGDGYLYVSSVDADSIGRVPFP
ncbi:MAG: SMP-30/gluconolactonase/LRE family protein [Pseudomonadota bacterium]